MAQAPLRCPKCDGEMAQGFILDATHHSKQLTSRWAEGAPLKSFWTTTKVEPDGQILPVGAFRCGTCGYLESYALPEFAPK